MAGKIIDHKDLRVWQDAMLLVKEVYRLTSRLPANERMILIPQLCRAAISVPANIAEGHGSSHRAVYLNHLSIARGSLLELDTYLILLPELGLVDQATIKPGIERQGSVLRQLHALIRSLKSAKL